MSALVFGSPEAAVFAEPRLEPCPFCQGRKLSIYMQRRLRAVQCSNCGAVGPTGHSRQEAVTLWNEQPQLAAATQRAEAAEAQLARHEYDSVDAYNARISEALRGMEVQP